MKFKRLVVAALFLAAVMVLAVFLVDLLGESKLHQCKAKCTAGSHDVNGCMVLCDFVHGDSE